MESSLKKKLRVAALLFIAFGGAAFARAQVGARVENWTVPDASFKTVDTGRPGTFVGMVPCRIVDTRGPAGPYGGPALAASSPRSFDLESGPCSGIPQGVEAYSLNFTVTQTQGPGDLRAWQGGYPAPLVSTLNYLGGQTIANAAIVPRGNGIYVVAAVSGTHLLIDINGYFTDEPNNGNNWLFIVREQGLQAFTVINQEGTDTYSGGIGGVSVSTGAGSYGVIGETVDGVISHENGGVLGRAGLEFAVPAYGQAGVRGESTSSFGVLGLSRDNYAVAGSNVNGAGGEATYGGLGCSDTVAVCGGGNLNISGTKSFIEPHPTDPSRVIEYVSLEGPEAGTYFRGRGRFTRGIARIAIPESFRMVTAEEGLSIQVTPIGEMATYAVVRIDLNEIVVKASRNVEFFYTVNGLRKGYEEFAPIGERNFFRPRSAEAKMPTSLSAEAKRKLIANGTYNPDGTVNMETAKRVGWAEKWKGDSAPKKE